jgi:hypothetical protein
LVEAVTLAPVPDQQLVRAIGTSLQAARMLAAVISAYENDFRRIDVM